jgi:hypothetical protein
MCRISCPEKITNEAPYDTTNSEPMGEIVKKRRLRWFGHVSRMDTEKLIFKPYCVHITLYFLSFYEVIPGNPQLNIFVT